MKIASENEYAVKDEMSFHMAVAQVRKHLSREGASEVQKSKALTIVSELGRNILKYAGEGVVISKIIDTGKKKGIEITAVDQGPGIEDLESAMEDNYSSSGTLGLGLPGAKRLSNRFNIHSTPGDGTSVTSFIWI